MCNCWYIPTINSSQNIVHTNHTEDYFEDGSVYVPKHVARDTAKTSEKHRELCMII